MKLYDRYVAGEDGRLIYDEIYNLGEDAFSDEYFDDINKVLNETFLRVSNNLKIIYSELTAIGYVLEDNAILPPSNDVDDNLLKLDEAISHFGFLPYSLKLFYKIAGSCNFAWNYKTTHEIFWPLADPLQIASLDEVISEVCSGEWVEYVNDMLVNYPEKQPSIELAADYLHKDNISGGEAYAIQLDQQKSIDSLFLNESHKVTFIEYLRICMDNCGFSKINDARQKNGYNDFFEKVRPQLKMI